MWTLNGQYVVFSAILNLLSSDVEIDTKKSNMIDNEGIYDPIEVLLLSLGNYLATLRTTLLP